MINWLLQYPIFYRLYQKPLEKNHEYDFFKFIFSSIGANKKIKCWLCSGDSFILKYVENLVSDYIGVDNNEKYLKFKIKMASL